MADNENDNEETETKDSKESGAGLRRLLEDALGELKTAKERLTEFEKKERVASLADLFKSAGAKAGAERFYPKDADTSEEAVKAWIEENADFVRDEGSGKPNVSDQTIVNTQRLNALADSVAQRPAGDISDITTRIAQAKTKEDLDAIYAELRITQNPN